MLSADQGTRRPAGSLAHLARFTRMLTEGSLARAASSARKFSSPIKRRVRSANSDGKFMLFSFIDYKNTRKNGIFCNFFRLFATYSAFGCV
jgi:hypothetical protein